MIHIRGIKSIIKYPHERYVPMIKCEKTSSYEEVIEQDSESAWTTCSLNI